VPCRSLGEYIVELVARLDAGDAAAGRRLREVVGSRRGLVRVDDEAVLIGFDAGGHLQVGREDGSADGVGSTDRQTVFDLEDGYIEVTDAILDGRLEVSGDTESVERMFVAIEILLDGAARIPALQALSGDFRDDPCRPPRGRPVPKSRRGPWQPTGRDEPEIELLERLGLLPDLTRSGHGADDPGSLE
jgi:hypothetical protein